MAEFGVHNLPDMLKCWTLVILPARRDFSSGKADEYLF